MLDRKKSILAWFDSFTFLSKKWHNFGSFQTLPHCTYWLQRTKIFRIRKHLRRTTDCMLLLSLTV